MKLAKYKGVVNNTLLNGWDNKPAIIYVSEVPSDYVDIHTISGVYNKGDEVFNFNQKRVVLSELFYEKAGESLENYETLTAEEKFIGAKLFFTPYSLRVTSGIFSDAQDIVNWDELVVKTQGTPVEQYEGRALVAETMRQHVGRNYLRKDLMTYANSKQFGEDAYLILEMYVKYASWKFYNWLTSKVGSEYEGNGFSEQTYLPTQGEMDALKDELEAIYLKG